MKRSLSICLAVCLLFTLTACSCIGIRRKSSGSAPQSSSSSSAAEAPRLRDAKLAEDFAEAAREFDADTVFGLLGDYLKRFGNLDELCGEFQNCAEYEYLEDESLACAEESELLQARLTERREETINIDFPFDCPEAHFYRLYDTNGYCWILVIFTGRDSGSDVSVIEDIVPGGTVREWLDEAGFDYDWNGDGWDGTSEHPSGGELPSGYGENMDWVSLETTYGKPYFDFLRHYEWLWYAGFDFSYVEDFSNQAWGDFFFHDVDHDGVVDLIIRAGTSVFDGECLIFTDVDGTVACMGRTSASGIDAALFGSEEETGLLMEDAYRGYLTVTEIGAKETENGVWIEAVGEFSIEMTEDDTGWHTDWTEPDGWYQLQPFSISDLLDAKYVRPSTSGDAFEVRDMEVSMTFPGEWDGHYRLYNSDASPELILYCQIGGKDYMVFTVIASGCIEGDGSVYLHGEEPVGTWDEEGRLLLVQRAIPDPDMVLHGSDEEREIYWTFFDMRDGVIASIRNDPQG